MADRDKGPEEALPRKHPSDHLEFELICSEVGDFETLPTLSTTLETEPEGHEETSFEDQILAGLVSPV